MSFPLTYDAIKRMLLEGVLSVPLCRDIVRKSGLVRRTGSIEAGSGLPPGGLEGQHLTFIHGSSTTDPANRFIWAYNNFEGFVKTDLDRGSQHDPLREAHIQTYTRYDTGTDTTTSTLGIPGTEADFTKTPVNPLGVGPRRIIHFGSLRNPTESPTYYTDEHEADPVHVDDYYSHPDLNRRIQPIGNHRARQFFIWEDIPEGEWYYPLNLHVFNKKVDFTASLRMNAPIQTRIEACVVEGIPDADLALAYSTSSRTGPWTHLASVDLSSGGAVRSEKHLLPEEAKADVWVCLRLVARSDIARLHLSYASARAQWLIPTDYWQPYRIWSS